MRLFEIAVSEMFDKQEIAKMRSKTEKLVINSDGETKTSREKVKPQVEAEQTVNVASVSSQD